MAEVRYDQATRVFPGADAAAVDALDLTLGDGELMVLVGPSGSGKSTALRMLAGLEEVDAGAVYIGDRDVTDVPPKQRDIAMVFQNYALYPYLDVEANIAFPLKMSRVPKAERTRRAREAAEMLGLGALLKRKPSELSGGERQRTAMGRAIVRDPQVFLMDEPLSNLDAKLRVQMRGDIAALQQRLGTTMLYVTHDQVEAMTMGHRVAVLANGRLQQCDTPRGLYDRPVEHVRRRLHRLAGDEPDRGADRRHRRSRGGPRRGRPAARVARDRAGRDRRARRGRRGARRGRLRVLRRRHRRRRGAASDRARGLPQPAAPGRAGQAAPAHLRGPPLRRRRAGSGWSGERGVGDAAAHAADERADRAGGDPRRGADLARRDLAARRDLEADGLAGAAVAARRRARRREQRADRLRRHLLRAGRRRRARARPRRRRALPARRDLRPARRRARPGGHRHRRLGRAARVRRLRRAQEAAAGGRIARPGRARRRRRRRARRHRAGRARSPWPRTSAGSTGSRSRPSSSAASDCR